DGMEALEKVQQQKFDLIISDILMPHMDGFELCRQVKRRPALRNIPFVFYTATYTDKKDEELAQSLGASRFILKPVEPEKFVEILKEVINETSTGQLKSEPMHEPEMALLNAYNQRLVHKLDEKIEELEASMRALRMAFDEKDKEMAERKRAEEEVRRLNIELEERVHQRTSELVASNRNLETFASALSHDLRAPLMSIDGWGQILLEDHRSEMDEDAVRCVNRMRAEAGRMGRLAEAMLKLCSVTRAPLSREKVNLSELARKIEADLRRGDPQRHIEFVIAPKIIANGDPALLGSLLQNLLDNAWKFTSKSSNSRIEFGATVDDGKTVYFVRDNGVGFDMRFAEKLFLPFQRLHQRADFPGTGLGLTTVQQIINRHGGRLWGEGEVGRGATFYFTLP
ncbi:MAG: ATP-binding protein, partial [Limisphaerales bacterium]